MGIFVRHLNAAGLFAIDIVEIRILLGCLFVGLYLAITDRSLLRIRLKDIWCFLGTGILSLLFFSWCYFTGMTAASLSVMSVLLYTSPAFVLIMCVLLFKEKLTKVKVLAIALNLAGCALVSGLGVSAEIGVKGLLLGLGAGFGYALYSIFSRCAILRRYSSWTITFYTFFFCAFGGAFLADWKNIGTALSTDPALLLWASVMALLTGFFAYVLYTKGLEGLRASYAAIVVSVEPVTATVFGTILFKEPLTAAMLAGIVLMLAGIAVMSLADG